MLLTKKEDIINAMCEELKGANEDQLRWLAEQFARVDLVKNNDLLEWQKNPPR